MDANEFLRNMSSHSLEELAPFEEQHVAWSEDGKRILAHAPTLDGLLRELEGRGVTGYVLGFVPNPDTAFLGGGTLDLLAPEVSDGESSPLPGWGNEPGQAPDPDRGDRPNGTGSM